MPVTPGSFVLRPDAAEDEAWCSGLEGVVTRIMKEKLVRRREDTAGTHPASAASQTSQLGSDSSPSPGCWWRRLQQWWDLAFKFRLNFDFFFSPHQLLRGRSSSFILFSYYCIPPQQIKSFIHTWTHLLFSETDYLFGINTAIDISHGWVFKQQELVV